MDLSSHLMYLFNWTQGLWPETGDSGSILEGRKGRAVPQINLHPHIQTLLLNCAKLWIWRIQTLLTNVWYWNLWYIKCCRVVHKPYWKQTGSLWLSCSGAWKFPLLLKKCWFLEQLVEENLLTSALRHYEWWGVTKKGQVQQLTGVSFLGLRSAEHRTH